MAAAAKSKGQQQPAARAPAPARPSASLILVSPLPQGRTTPDGFEYMVCLIKRNSRMSTAPSATVFPGGNMDEADTRLALQLTGGTNLQGEEKDRVALRVCAIRETFEETGVLLTCPVSGKNVSKEVGTERLSSWRKEVYQNPDCLLDKYTAASHVVGSNVVPPFQDLILWSNWVTPLAVPKRFDTSFFLHILPSESPLAPTAPNDSTATSSEVPHESPALTIDETETIAAAWITPRKALDECIREQSTIFLPPQAWLLAELCRYPTLSGLRAHAAVRRVDALLPRVIAVDPEAGRLAFVLPGDDDYDGIGKVAASPRDKKLHRTYIAAARNKKTGRLVPVAPPRIHGLVRRNIRGLDNVVEGNIFESPDHTDKAKL